MRESDVYRSPRMGASVGPQGVDFTLHNDGEADLKLGKSKTQTTSQTVDPASQTYIDNMRKAAQGAAGTATGGDSFFTGPQTRSVADQAGDFFNPYMSNVVDATRGEFDFMRGGAAKDAAQQATQAGAFGGSRAAISQGTRLGAIDRAQGSTVAGLLQSGWQDALSQGTAYSEHQRQLQQEKMQEPLFRQHEAMGFLSGGMGPTGTTSKTVTPGNLFGDLAGIAQIGAGFLTGGASTAATGAMRAMIPRNVDTSSYQPQPGYRPRGLFG